MLRYFTVIAFVVQCTASTASSDELPRKVFGIWSEPAGNYQCGEQIFDIEKGNTKIEVSGRTGDWTCSWTGARKIAVERIKSKITGTTTEIFAYYVKTQCEKVGGGIDNSGIAIVVFEPKASIEELYIHSAADAYAGSYRRCKK